MLAVNWFGYDQFNKELLEEKDLKIFVGSFLLS